MPKGKQKWQYFLLSRINWSLMLLTTLAKPSCKIYYVWFISPAYIVNWYREIKSVVCISWWDQVTFKEMMMSGLYKTIMLNLIFIVLAHWNNSSWLTSIMKILTLLLLSYKTCSKNKAVYCQSPFSQHGFGTNKQLIWSLCIN
jgi:hypothetical protein